MVNQLFAAGDAVRWIDAALDAAGNQAPVRCRADAHLKRALLLGLRGQALGQADAANEALELYRQLKHDLGIAIAYNSLAGSAAKSNDLDQQRACAEAVCRHARVAGSDALLGRSLAKLAPALPPDERLPVLEHAAELLQQAGNFRELAHAYGNAAYTALIEDRVAEAISLLDIAMPAAEKLTDPTARGLILGNLGLARLFSGRPSQARAAFTGEVLICGKQALGGGTEEGLAGLAAVSAEEGSDERAARLIGAARALGYDQPSDRVLGDRLQRDYFASARTRLGSASWRRAEREGAAMSYEQAITYALDQ
jgi:hypothetical protein